MAAAARGAGAAPRQGTVRRAGPVEVVAMNRLLGHLSSAAGALALMALIVVGTGAVLV